MEKVVLVGDSLKLNLKHPEVQEALYKQLESSVRVTPEIIRLQREIKILREGADYEKELLREVIELRQRLEEEL